MGLYSRRAFLAVAGAAALAGASSRAATRAKRDFLSRQHIKLGLQLYTLGDDLKRDLDAGLRQVAAIGFTRVETAGLLGRTATDFRRSLDRAGLSCTSMHVSPHPLSPGPDATLDDMAKVIENAHALGARYVVNSLSPLPKRDAGDTRDFLAWLKDVVTKHTADDWIAIAEFLNDKGRMLAAAGLKFGYHNHHFEFLPIGDTTGFDILMRHTDPSWVCFEMDAGWVGASGNDPVAVLARYPGRFRLMHVKDFKPAPPVFAVMPSPTDLGGGTLDWRRILTAARRAGVDDFFVEQEPPFTRPRIDAAAIGYRYLAGL